ncbi:hypothetical protein BGX26_012760 [Mortierella sp. AD094]|nr:hypothetical protein BGX26_012760 [Mortierella sp. AD094]
MASFPRAKVDSSTQTDPPLPFTALLDRTLDRVEATVPLNLSSITFYIRRHHLSRIEQIEALLSKNFFFKFILYRIGLKPQHVFSFLCLVTLYGCRQLYRRSVYLTTNLCAVAYPAYCSIRTINSEPIKPPRGLGLEPTEYGPMYSLRRSSSIYSSSGSLHSNRHRARKRRSRMSNSMLEDSMQSSNSYSSSQEDYDSRRSVASSWGRPSEYSNYSEDNLTTTSGSVSMTVEEKMKQRMRRKWVQFSQTRKDKATRQWLAYWSIYGTVQVVDTWSSFLLDWIPGYNLGKLLFLWWAQRRGATLVFDYFQPLIQSKNKDGREVARKPSNRSLNSEMSHERGGPSGGAEGSGSGSGLRPRSIQMLPSTLAHQQQQQHQQYQQQQFEQQFYAKGSSSRRDTAAFRDLNQNRHRRDNYYDDDEEEDDDEEYHSHSQQQQYILQQQQLQQQHQKQQGQPLDLRRELMTSSPHDSGSFAETPLFESAESVWSAPPATSSVLAVDSEGMGGASFGSAARLHSNNATPTPMSVQEQYHLRQQLHQSTQKQQTLIPDANSSTIHWNPTTSSATSTEEL